MSDVLRTTGQKTRAFFARIGGFIARHKKLFIILVALVLVAAVLLVVLGNLGGASATAAAPPQTLTLERMNLEQMVAGTGKLQTATPREVTSGLSYEVQAVYVEEGDRVTPGQLLAQLDTADLDKDIATTRQSIAEAEAKDALSLSQAERKLQDAISTRDINAANNAASVQAAADAIEAARVAAGNAALEQAAAADATAKTNAALSTLNAAKSALTTAQSAYAAQETAYQTLLGQQALLNQTVDEAERANLLALWGYPDAGALNAAVDSALMAMNNEAPNVQAAQGSVDQAQASYDSAYQTAYEAFVRGNNQIYKNAYNTADVSALQTAYDNAVQARDTASRTDNASVQNAQDAVNTQKLQDSASSYRTQLESYLDDKEKCAIEAPVAGTITSMTAEVGKSAGGSATASAAGSATGSSALFTIENIGSLEIAANIPEYDAVLVEPGMQALITSDALSGEEWAGTVNSVSAKAADDSGNFTVVVGVTSPVGELSIGMSAKINIITHAKNDVFAVPYDAVTTDEGGNSVVYVFDQDQAAQAGASGAATDAAPAELGSPVPVQTGMETDYYIEITGAGLSEGLVILADPEGRNVSADTGNMAFPGGF